MNKKFLMGVSAATCALVVGALMSVGNSLTRSSAAVIKDSAAHYEDTFSTLNAEKWSRVGDSEASMYEMVDETVVEVPSVTLTGYNANNGQMGWFRTEQQISLDDGKSLVVDVQGQNWTEGMIAFHGLRNTDPELGASLGVGFTTDGQCAGVGDIVPDTVWTGLGATNFHSATKFRFTLNPDGTGRVDGLVAADGSKISETGCPGTAFTGMPFAQKGYWGLQGFNGFNAEITKVVVGQANADGSGYEQLFVSNLVPGHQNMNDHGNVRWGTQTTSFKEVRVQSEGYVNFKAFNYNDGFYTTKTPVTIEEDKVIYYEISMYDWAGRIGFTGVESGYSWPNFFDINAEENNATNNVAGGSLTFEVTNSGWHNITPARYPNGLTLRVAIDSEGNGKFGTVAADGSWEHEEGLALVADLTGMHYAQSGYVGFYGNLGTLDTKVKSITIGQADDLSLTNAEVVRAEDFTCGVPELFENKLIGSSCSSDAIAPVFGKEVHELQLHSPVAGSGLVYTGNTINEGEGKLAEVSLTITPTRFTTGASVGLAFGADEEHPVGQAKALVSFDGTAIKLNDEALTLSSLGEPVTLHTVVYSDKIVANVGEVEAVVETEAVVGNVAIVGESSENSLNAKVNSFVYDSYLDVDRNGRNIEVTSFNEENLDWFYHRVDDEEQGKVELDNGKVKITGKDGVYFGTKESYANFEVEADFEYKYDEEEEMITSVWAGLCFGKEVEYAGCAWAGDTNAPFIYFQNMVIDYMNLPTTGRGWTSAENNPMQEGNNHVKLRAEDGHVQMWFNHGEQAPALLLDLYDINTVGRIAFACTNGSNYSISSFKVTNLDHPENVNPTDTTEVKAASVEQGASIEGTISGTSVYGTPSIVLEENGLAEQGNFVLTANGAWTFTANENAVVGEYTVTYAIVDDNVKTTGTLTITITEKTVVPPVDSSEPETSEPDSSEPETSEPGQEEPAKKGCKGSVLAASGIVALISLVGATLAISKKKED